MLNKKLKRSPYPLPRIDDTLQQLEGFQYATALDLNMGYYHLRLDPAAQDACTIVTEFGKFAYQRLPMGVACAPDIFQSKINELLGKIKEVRSYMDDILMITKGSFQEHLEVLETVFQNCNAANLKINPLKSFWGLSEVEYLGYIITREGIKPQRCKIEAILNMQVPKTTSG